MIIMSETRRIDTNVVVYGFKRKLKFEEICETVSLFAKKKYIPKYYRANDSDNTKTYVEMYFTENDKDNKIENTLVSRTGKKAIKIEPNQITFYNNSNLEKISKLYQEFLYLIGW